MEARAWAAAIMGIVIGFGVVQFSMLMSPPDAGEGRMAPATVPDGDGPVNVTFLVVGDTGTGDDAQRRTGEAMATVCATHGCDFVVGTGDNFYDMGVESIHDPQWRTSFEEPYANLTVPFHMVLGNHDVWGDAQAQVDYTYLSEKWHMPGRWYAHAHGDAFFVALDTTAPDEPAQAAFVDAALRNATATWTFAHGHHPDVSNGKHGDIDADVASFLEEHVCQEVDVYFAGHDHLLSWFDARPACAATLIVSGAGGAPRSIQDPDRHPARWQQGDTLGFVWVQVSGDDLTLRFYDGDATLLFEDVLTKSL